MPAGIATESDQGVRKVLIARKLVTNTGNDRVVDIVTAELRGRRSVGIVTQLLSIFGFDALVSIAATHYGLPIVRSV